MWRRPLILAFLLLLFPTIAHAQPWTPGPHAQGDATVAGFIDTPAGGTSYQQGVQFDIAGWVVDSAVTSSTGIDEIHVYRGTAADQFLGRATYGTDRPDVSSHFGVTAWRQSGFTFRIDTTSLPVGDNTITVYAHTPTRGWWTRSVTINVTQAPIQADPTEDTIAWTTPHNRTLTTMPSLQPALGRLAQTPWGNWALAIAADKDLEVLWSTGLGQRFSQYQYGSRVILLNAAYKETDSRAVAAAIAHELQHAVDDGYGWASWRAVSCWDLAARSFLAQAAVWTTFYGPFGKVQAVDQLEEAHNAVLQSVTARPDSWLDDAIRSYRSPC